MWQHAQFSEQLRHEITLACLRDVKQATNQQLPLLMARSTLKSRTPAFPQYLADADKEREAPWAPVQRSKAVGGIALHRPVNPNTLTHHSILQNTQANASEHCETLYTYVKASQNRMALQYHAEISQNRITLYTYVRISQSYMALY